MKSSVLLLSALLLVTASCKTVTEPAEVIPPHQWHKPTIGSTYLYVGEWTDATDSANIQRDIVTSTQRIVDTNVTWGGKSGLIAFSIAANTLYYGTESDGNLTIGASAAGSEVRWTPYPTATKNKLTQRDTTFTQSGYTTIYKFTTEYVGDETIDYRGRPLATVHIREKRVTSIIGSGLELIQMYTDEYWYSPELKTFAKFSDAFAMHYNEEVLADTRTDYTLELFTQK